MTTPTKRQLSVDAIMRAEQRGIITARQREILLLRKADDPAGRPVSQTKIGSRYGISPQRVGQIERRAREAVAEMIDAETLYETVRDDAVDTDVSPTSDTISAPDTLEQPAPRRIVRLAFWRKSQ